MRATNDRPFAAVPGVKYPARSTEMMSTETAADVLGMTPASARQFLRRKKCRPAKMGCRAMWNGARVRELAAELPQLVESPMPGFLTRDETLARLGRSLRTLREWEASGRLPFTEVRMGSRRWHVYHEKSVARLAAANND